MLRSSLRRPARKSDPSALSGARRVWTVLNPPPSTPDGTMSRYDHLREFRDRVIVSGDCTAATKRSSARPNTHRDPSRAASPSTATRRRVSPQTFRTRHQVAGTSSGRRADRRSELAGCPARRAGDNHPTDADTPGGINAFSPVAMASFSSVADTAVYRVRPQPNGAGWWPVGPANGPDDVCPADPTDDDPRRGWRACWVSPAKASGLQSVDRGSAAVHRLPPVANADMRAAS
jgi:hypothetical protein